MTTFLVKLINLSTQFSQDFLYKDKDTRLDGVWLMSSLLPTIYATVLYLVFCKVIGPKLMEKRKPYKLKNVIFWYNIFQVLCSAYICYEVFDIEWFTTLKVTKCQPVDYSDSSRSMRTLRAFYLYYLLKFIEYLDTIFFVLRKKQNQISFLHLYHHASMPLYAWFVAKSFAGGSWVLIPLENSFVHVVMYTYYLLAGLGPQVQKYLWWKKYITLIQMIQFIIGMIHFLFVLADPSPTCNLQKSFIVTGLFVAFAFYFLFSQFYNSAYVSSTNESVENGHSNQNGIKVKPLLSNNEEDIASKLK